MQKRGMTIRPTLICFDKDASDTYQASEATVNSKNQIPYVTLVTLKQIKKDKHLIDISSHNN